MKETLEKMKLAAATGANATLNADEVEWILARLLFMREVLVDLQRGKVPGERELGIALAGWPQ